MAPTLHHIITSPPPQVPLNILSEKRVHKEQLAKFVRLYCIEVPTSIPFFPPFSLYHMPHDYLYRKKEWPFSLLFSLKPHQPPHQNKKLFRKLSLLCKGWISSRGV
ncbi:hypothetical protein J5N97_000767 [Dioscorea zingiberensis]|uniref:Uncharacterized protein n=1 Tax=Dioscorea zingiberensis TaxID=325984 RepID=A0A9D5BUW2_9LILI|nr:hypothetical protein J5N97_000767 [Dioscorea zingiberensis]